MLEGCAVVTSGTQMIDMVKEQGWTGKRAILFGWDVPRPELDSLELNYAADVEKEGDVAFLIGASSRSSRSSPFNRVLCVLFSFSFSASKDKWNSSAGRTDGRIFYFWVV